MYENGEGIPTNVGKAVELYQQAHLAGNTDATKNLAVMYEDGNGVPKDVGKALELYQQAHLAGNTKATQNLALMYSRLQQAHLAGDKGASFNLAVMYEYGHGIPTNVTKALELYQEAHIAGNALATDKLATMYKKSVGNQHSSCKSLELCNQALPAHNAVAVDSSEAWRWTTDLDTANEKCPKPAIASASSFGTGPPPMISQPAPQSTACASCGAKGKCMLCTGCRRVCYCSIVCQRRHQRSHKAECQAAPLAVEYAQAPVLLNYMALAAPDDLDAGIEASLVEADLQAATENSQISEALLWSHSNSTSVYLLEFSRDPESFDRALLHAEQLQDCQGALRAHGYSALLPSGAKAFLRPEVFVATLDAVRLLSLDLKPRHVLVVAELEETVTRIVKSLDHDQRVKCKGRTTVPLAFASAALQSSLDVIISRTFVDIKEQNSLHSSATSGMVTVSTTDARSIPNPRAAAPACMS